MKNSDFLIWFNGLHKSNSKENIILNANNIVSSISKTENGAISNKEKYKNFLKVFASPCEDLLYTINRLIGGICSTGIEYREGFGITLQLFLDKYSKEINFVQLLESIQKESYVPKSEKNNVKICSVSGKIFIYKILLGINSLSEDNILYIIKQILPIAKQNKNLEEGCILLIKEIFDKILGEFYDIKKNKLNRLLEGIFKSLDIICAHKNDYFQIDNNLEFCIYFLLMNYIDNIKKFISQKIQDDFFDNNNEESKQPLFKYFTILLNLPIKYQNINTKNANIFNHSFKLLYDLLIKINNSKYAYKIWNILIDPKCVEEFMKISSKNFEFLIYSYSLFLIQNFFNLKNISQIFDESFFLSLIQFNNNKRIKYVVNITQIITEKISALNEEENDNKKIIQDYCLKCLKIFGIEADNKYTPKTLKNFYLFLLEKLSEEQKAKYINNLLTSDNDKIIEEIQFNLNALKILYSEESNSKIINEETKNKIIEYFLQQYYSDQFGIDINYSYNIEEMTLNLILGLIKPNILDNKPVPLKSSNVINILVNVHKIIQNLIENKKILYNEEENQNSEEIVENDELNEFKKSYKKKFKNLTKEKNLNSTKSRIVVKFGLIILFLYLKHPNDFEEDVDDLIGIIEHNFDKDWMKVFTALCLNLIHKGSPLINDAVLNEYKKMSYFIGKDGFDVIVEYLKDTKIKKDKKKMKSDISSEGEESNIENKNKNGIELDEEKEEI